MIDVIETIVFTTDTEQKQLFKAIQIIQNAFRKFKVNFLAEVIFFIDSFALKLDPVATSTTG